MENYYYIIIIIIIGSKKDKSFCITIQINSQNYKSTVPPTNV